MVPKFSQRAPPQTTDSSAPMLKERPLDFSSIPSEQAAAAGGSKIEQSGTEKAPNKEELERRKELVDTLERMKDMTVDGGDARS